MAFMLPVIYYSGLILLLAALTKAKRVEHNWDVTYTTGNPDGLFERVVVGINGQWPLPIVEAEKGDTVVINVRNQLDDWTTTLHAHGLYQNGTSYQDGGPGVSECGVPPGDVRTYEYNLGDQTGTYWIHSHVDTQYLDGLRTPFVIHDPEDPYKDQYDEELIVTVSDWYHNQSRVNAEWFLSKQNLDAAEPMPQSGVVNDQPDAKFYFEPGKTYRLRLINMGGYTTFYFSIDGHEFDIIEVDGAYTEPYRAKNAYLTVAQRMSILVKAKEKTDLNYFMHFDMDQDQFDLPLNGLNPNITAKIIYDDSHDNYAPSEDIGMKSQFDDFDLRSLADQNSVDPDRTLNITIEEGITTDGLNRGMVNRIPFIKPLTPMLFSELTMGGLADDHRIYGPQSNAYITKHLEFVELVVNNYDEDAHPFHLHGHKFQVVARGTHKKQMYHEGDGTSVGNWNLEKPVLRDTLRVHGQSFAVIRYRADNPGAWLFHCHIDWHFLSGMGIVMIEAPDQAQEMMQVPPELAAQCKKLGLPSSGNGAGKQGYDLSGAPHGIYYPRDKPLSGD